ncbi:MAG: efflux RND transporter periplasmic adaptor subunit [Acidobacteria bacterium]|nr:efflux RND transporter periplasmic adaptor subunit [Acidobacteriota bacterium]
MALTAKPRSKKRRIIVTLILVAILAVGGYLLYSSFFGGKADVEFTTAAVERGAIRNTVTATGTVQAVLTVQVGTQVSGQIEKLYADYNSVVKHGQLLAEIDPRNFQSQVQNAEASLSAARARVAMAEADIVNQQANLRSARANIEAARATRDNDALTLRRNTDLVKGGIAAQSDLDNAKAAADASAARYQQTEAALAQVEAQLRSAKAQLAQAKAQEEQAVAALDQARTNLGYTDIICPVDGVVVSRSVDVGQTVASSLQAPTLFVIANDLTKMQVNASVDEADIGKISDKVDIKFTVDAYPQESFTGKISEIRLNPTTVQNVVTYNVVISVDNSDLKLKPGMTANITMTVEQRENVLRVPNASLRYLPPGMTQEKVRELMKEIRGGFEGSEGRGGREPAPSAGGTGATAPASPADGQTAPRGRGRREEAPQTASAGTAAGKGAALPPDVEALLEKMRDPNLTPEEKRELFGKLRQLPEEQRQLIRARFTEGRGGRSQDGVGATGGASGPAGRKPAPAVAEKGAAGLAPGQLWDPADKIRFPEPRTRRQRPGIVWVMDAGGKPAVRKVVLGITDGANTELVGGDLKEGDKVIVSDTSQSNGSQRPGASGGQQQRSPFMSGPPGGGRR